MANTDKNRIWRTFHKTERQLFDYLVDNCDCLFAVEGDELLIVNTPIRMVLRWKDRLGLCIGSAS